MVEEILLEAIDHLLHRETATEESGRGEFVAVGDRLSLHDGGRVVEKESISCAESTDNDRTTLEVKMGDVDGLITVAEHLDTVGM